MQAIDMVRKGLYSSKVIRPTLWSEAIAWLERHRPHAQLAYAAAPTEILDARFISKLLRESNATDGRRWALSGHQKTSKPAMPSSLLAETALSVWLSGQCAIPRLRGLRYGGESCALPSAR